MGLASFIMVRAVEVLVVIILITFMPSIPPNTHFTHFKVQPSLPLEGKLSLNERLNGVQHLYENEIKGPEAFADWNGELYSTLHGGDVVKLVGDHIIPIVKFGKPCKSFHEESTCGRPLGLVFDKDGMLYVADAYMGIFKVDVKTGKKTQLVFMDKEIEGRKPMIPNSIAVSKSGDIYWTDSSSEFKLEDGVFTMLADASGRLFHYNPLTKTNKVLIDGIHFANGVILSSDEEFLIVSETARSRIHRYYLKGSKKGTKDIFIDGLPGLPDNLKSDGKDGFLIPLVIARDADHPVVFQIFGPFPYVRKFFARILGIAEVGFKTIENLYPNFYSQRAIHWIGHFESMSVLSPRRATVLHVSKDGKILDSIHSDDLSISGISEAHIFKDTLYLGSPFNNYVGKLPLSKVGWQHLAQTVEKREKRETVRTETPKPTQAPTAAPVKKPPPPTAVPVKTAPPTAAPVKTPPPTVAPVKTPPPVVKQVPPKEAPKQTPPKAEAVKQAPPTAEPVKQTPPTQATKQAPPPVKEVPKQAPPPVKEVPKQAPSTKEAPKQAPPPAPKQAPAKEAAKVKEVPKQAPPPVKEAPKQAPPTKEAPKQASPTQAPKQEPPVVPVKEKLKPKSESIPPRK